MKRISILLLVLILLGTSYAIKANEYLYWYDEINREMGYSASLTITPKIGEGFDPYTIRGHESEGVFIFVSSMMPDQFATMVFGSARNYYAVEIRLLNENLFPVTVSYKDWILACNGELLYSVDTAIHESWGSSMPLRGQVMPRSDEHFWLVFDISDVYLESPPLLFHESPNYWIGMLARPLEAIAVPPESVLIGSRESRFEKIEIRSDETIRQPPIVVKQPRLEGDGVIVVKQPRLEGDGVSVGVAGKIEIMTDQIIAEIITASMGTDDKIKAIYDFLIYQYLHIKLYDPSYRETHKDVSKRLDITPLLSEEEVFMLLFENPLLFGVATLLVNEEGVCSDFAELFSHLLSKVGIESEVVNGYYLYSDGSTTGHTWNRVNVDGTWYWYDVDVEGSVFRNGDYSTPIYHFYKKDSEFWATNHVWEEGF